MKTISKFKSSAALMLCVLLVMVCTVFSLTGCQKEEKLTKVKLNEVAHSIFYAPMYVAYEMGYFEEEGLSVEIANGLGADKTMTALLAGECDIGFMGSESTIYVYNQGEKDYAVNFAQLTQRAGNFLVGPKAEENFDWQSLKGKEVLGGRTGGMPEMVFEYILRKKGIDPENDLTIVKNIDFGLTAEAFASGQGDYTVEFEPYAASLEQDGKGYVVASLGEESGYVPYTAFSVRKSYMEKNGKVLEKFTRAIQRGLDYVNTHSPEEIAAVIKPQFSETEDEKLIAILKRYAGQDTWKSDTVFEKESFELLEDILIQAGELEGKVPYEDLVNTDYAKKAAKK